MIHNLLQGKKIILASASPRRKEIFKLVGIKALQFPSGVAEEKVSDNPIKLVKYHASHKAATVKKHFETDCLIVAADTIVYQNDEVLEKPLTKLQAAEFLSRLSDNVHFVYTGVSIAYKNQLFTDYEKTKVTFHPLSARDIEEYIKTGEPMDKAGAYGVQGYGSQFIKQISGCYFNVMGFPVALFYRMLEKIL
ncbi:MAG TPA: nucleoside triphosphate pyrophosphatase [Candidatus Cloacimonadota bacterium]|nr:nucleoside triphosphate pyrophosphatase [Candidatus Cloacimonadota bacterium]